MNCRSAWLRRASIWTAACSALLSLGACGGNLGGENSELGDGAVVDAAPDVLDHVHDGGAIDGAADHLAPAANDGDAADAAASEAGDSGTARDAAEAGDAQDATVRDANAAADAPLGDAPLDGPREASADGALDAPLGADEGPPTADDGGDAGSALCVDVEDDPHNCGACGHDCLGGGCSAGLCLPIALFAPAEGFPSGLAIEAGRLYWIDTPFSAVWSVSVDGGDSTVIASPNRPTAIAANPGAVYWLSNGMLQSLPFGATTPTTLATGGAAYGLALSPTQAYWTDIETDTLGNAMGHVFSAPIAGGPVTTLSSTENVPTQIVVTPSNLYWIDLNTELPFGTTSLMEAPLTGGGPVAVVPTTPGGGSSGADAITTYGSNVYFTIGGTLYSLPVGGTQATLLAADVHPSALAVDASGIYAATRGEILYVPLAGGVATPLAQGLSSPAGIVLDDNAIYFTDVEVVWKLAKPVAPSAVDGGAPTGPPDDELTTVLAQCSGARDVLYVNQTGPSSLAGIPLGVSMNTNLDSLWSSRANPLSVAASASAPIGVLGGGSVGATTVQGIPLVPGVIYPQPINSTVPRPSLALQLIDVNLTSAGGTGGSFRIQDMQVDATGTTLTSWLIGFDLTVAANSTSRFLGCMRYSADPVDPNSPDGVTEPGTSILDGVSGAGLLAPCAGGGNHMYLERTGGYPGVQGITDLTPANASFATSSFGSTLDIGAQSGTSTWEIGPEPVPNGVPAPGVYSTSDPSQPVIQIGTTPGGGCVSFPTGTYGISQLVYAPSNPNEVVQMQMWFDLQCAGVGALRGCAVYGN